MTYTGLCFDGRSQYDAPSETEWSQLDAELADHLLDPDCVWSGRMFLWNELAGFKLPRFDRRDRDPFV